MSNLSQTMNALKKATPQQTQAMLKELRELKAEFPLKHLEPTKEHMRMAILMKRAIERIEGQESEYCRHEVTPIECYSRDGFIPHSHNHGGYSVHILKSLMEVNDSAYYENQDYHYNIIQEQNPELATDSEEFSDLLFESMADSHDDICYLEARVMFHGIDDDGLYSATLEMIYRTSDAPYFRYADSFEDFELEWTTSSELETALNRALVKAGVKK